MLPYQTRYQTVTILALVISAIATGYNLGALRAKVPARQETSPLGFAWSAYYPQNYLSAFPLDERLTQEPLLSLPLLHYRRLSSSYGWRQHPFTGQLSRHDGLDFSAPAGTPVHAAACGMVKKAQYQAGYGYLVDIDHGSGLATRYAHAQSILVKAGQFVGRGDIVAHVGSSGASTGPHLHFEVRRHNKVLDPRLFLGGRLLTSPIRTPIAIFEFSGPSVR